MSANRDAVGNIFPDVAIKAPVRCATTANITLSGLQTIDGVTVAEGNRVLVKNQTDATENGIYSASTGNWTRTTDCNDNADFIDGTAVLVSQGTTQANLIYRVDTDDDPVVIDTTEIVWTLLPPGSASTAWQAIISKPTIAQGLSSAGITTQWQAVLDESSLIGLRMPATATGTNAITLTPGSSLPVPAYFEGLSLIFRAAATTTGAVTARVGALAFKKVLSPDGHDQLGTLDLQIGRSYELVYSTAADSAAGGWLLVTPSAVGLPGLFGHGGLGFYNDGSAFGWQLIPKNGNGMMVYDRSLAMWKLITFASTGLHSTVRAGADWIDGVPGQNLSTATVYDAFLSLESDGTLHIDWSAIQGSVTHPTLGFPVLGGNQIETLVGRAFIVNTTQGLQGGAGSEYIISYYQRGRVTLESGVSGSTASTAYVEIDTADRVDFLVWPDDLAFVHGLFSVACTTANRVSMGLAITTHPAASTTVANREYSRRLAVANESEPLPVSGGFNGGAGGGFYSFRALGKTAAGTLSVGSVDSSVIEAYIGF